MNELEPPIPIEPETDAPLSNENFSVTVEIDTDPETLARAAYLTVNGRTFVERTRAEELTRNFVAMLIREGKLTIAPGHEEYFEELNP